MRPFNKDLVAKAGDLYNRLLLDGKKDIRILEKLEEEADDCDCFKTVKDNYDYNNLSAREYLKQHPFGLHKEDASKKMEEDDFKQLGAVKYLKKYPNGLYKEKALQTVNKNDDDSFQSEMTPESYLINYPNGRHSEEAKFYRDNSVIKYLKKYPNGRYAEDAKITKDVIVFVIVVVALLLAFVIFNQTN